MMADVIGMPIRIHQFKQTCALGAAMFAAVVAGIYPNVEEAMAAMGGGFDEEYFPDREKASLYESRYKQYADLGSYIEKQRG
jgi:L-ribulokinase